MGEFRESDVENPYRVLRDSEIPPTGRQENPGRWVRLMQVMASMIAIFSILVLVASIYEIWLTIDAPAPFNSPQWRNHYIRALMKSFLGFCSAAAVIWLLPTRRLAGHLMFVVSLLFQFLLLRNSF